MAASLQGCIVLVVEDEPLIALDIAQSFKNAGAEVVISRTLEDAIERQSFPISPQLSSITLSTMD